MSSRRTPIQRQPQPLPRRQLSLRCICSLWVVPLFSEVSGAGEGGSLLERVVLLPQLPLPVACGQSLSFLFATSAVELEVPAFICPTSRILFCIWAPLGDSGLQIPEDAVGSSGGVQGPLSCHRGLRLDWRALVPSRSGLSSSSSCAAPWSFSPLFCFSQT